MAKTYLGANDGATYKTLARFVGGTPFDGRAVVDSYSDISGTAYRKTFGGSEFENVDSFYEGMLVVTKDTGKLYVLTNGEFKEVSSSGDYNDLINKPDIPVYSAGSYITIKDNMVNVNNSLLEQYFNTKYHTKDELSQLFSNVNTALSNRYTKTETYSKDETDTLIANAINDVDDKIANAINEAITEVLNTPL